MTRTGAKMDVFVKLVLVFFISLLSFSIGTFVGKKFSDNQHKLAQFEPHGEAAAEMQLEATAEGNKGETEGIKPKEVLTDEEIAKLAEEFATNDEELETNNNNSEASQTADEIAHDQSAAKAVEKSAAKAVEKSAEKTMANAQTAHPVAAQAAHPVAAQTAHPVAAQAAHPVANSVNSKAAAIAQNSEGTPQVGKSTTSSSIKDNPSTSIKDTPPTVQSSDKRAPASQAITPEISGKYTVQVGSYNQESEARLVADSLYSKGLSSFYLPVHINSKNWYRVNVGIFATKQEAEKKKNELVIKSQLNNAIIQKIP